MGTYLHQYLMIPLALVVAAGFIFLWHKWNAERTVIWLVCSIVITFVVALCIIFAAATLIIYLLSL